MSAVAKHTASPWRYEPGGGHAYNSIVGAESIHIRGQRQGERSFTDRVCENLGDAGLPGPAANIALIVAAPDLLAALIALRDWHKGEYQSNDRIDAQADAAIDKATNPSAPCAHQPE